MAQQLTFLERSTMPMRPKRQHETESDQDTHEYEFSPRLLNSVYSAKVQIVWIEDYIVK